MVTLPALVIVLVLDDNLMWRGQAQKSWQRLIMCGASPEVVRIRAPMRQALHSQKKRHKKCTGKYNQGKVRADSLHNKPLPHA